MLIRMARPYGDPVEILTAPVPAQSPFIPTDAKIVVGAVAPCTCSTQAAAADEQRSITPNWRKRK